MKQTMIVLMIVFSILACQGQDTGQVKSKETQTKEESTEMTVAVIKTNMGTIEIELFAKETPKTVENFVGLANKEYYNGVIFHRVIDNFMIQGGDPTGTGRGGDSFWGGKFADEIVPALKHDVPGILSMANAGPNTNGSQFFITLVATPWLDGKHTIFGKVIAGMDVVSAIGKVATSKPGDKPLKDVVKTNMGTIEIELFAKETPKTVENFVGLANKEYYNGVIFHRVIDNFMIQGGDPTGTGRGGASFWGGKFEDEIVPALNMISPEFYQWLMPDQIQTEVSFSLHLLLLHG